MAPATAALALGIGGLGMGAIGTVASGVAAAGQAKSQQAMAEYNAQVAQQQAKAEMMRAQFEQRRQAEEGARRSSSLLAAMGASGAVPGTGAPLLIEETQAQQSDLESQMIGYEGMLRASRASSEALLARSQADIYGKRASSAAWGGAIGAGSSFLTGLGQYGMLKYGVGLQKKAE